MLFRSPGLSVYQATIRDTHEMVMKGLEELLITSGHCVRYENGQLALSANFADLSKIKFYWMIPFQKKTQWLKKRPVIKNDLKKRPVTKNDLTMKSILEQCVEQFVLIVGGEHLAKHPENVAEVGLDNKEEGGLEGGLEDVLSKVEI